MKPFGRYTLIERIARGGMAEVWKARYTAGEGVEKIVVVKRILQDYADDEDFVTLFRDEARLTLQLSHANIVQVFDYGKFGEEPFLAMEWVEGQNLRALLRRSEELDRPALPLGIALLIASEVARGLAYAHSRRDESGQPLGIVHRDVTPTNILVSYAAEVKIADFGIARAASRSTRTRTGVVRGKPGYLPPEAVRERPYDGRADMFSLGAVLWEMIAGRKLVGGESDLAVIGRIASGEPFARLRDAADVSPEIDSVVMRSLEREPEARFPDAQAFHDALAPLAAAHGGTANALAQLMDSLFADERRADAARSADEEGSTAATLPVGLPRGEQMEVATAATIPRKPPGRRWRPAPLLAALASVAVVAVAGSQLRPDTRATPTTVPATSLFALVTDTASPTASETAASPPTPRRTSAIAVPTASLEPGIVGVNSEPSGEIFIDGVATERETPAFDLVVPAGRHEIRIVNPVSKLEARFFVDVAPGSRTAHPKVTLTPP